MMSRTTRRAAAGLGIAAFVSMGALTACGGSESTSPSSTTTTTTAPSTTVSPSEKGLTPGGGNSFSPQVKAPPAPTGAPGTNHTG